MIPVFFLCYCLSSICATDQTGKTMYIQQLYTNCLAQAAYYIEAGNEAAIIDPLRNPEPYIALANERGATIKYVLETHFHADFVSGHIDLANKTGATIVFGPDATPGYKAYIAQDGEMLKLSDMHIEVLHTPGHTIESACYLLRNAHNNPVALFSGDTLFVGDVGRPDLLSGNLSKEVLAGMLFDSLKNKIKTLPDELIVYPGHGAGSACGKNLGTESQSTIGHEKSSNYALKLENRDAFIKAVTADQPVAPSYFFKDASINKTGYSAFDEIMRYNMKALPVSDFKNFLRKGTVLLDTREPMVFAAGFIPGAINIGLDGDFAVWVGTLVNPDTPLLLVAEEGREKEAIERLARIGYENVWGYLQGSMLSWFIDKQEYEQIMTFEGEELRELLSTNEYNILDVRNRREVARDRITGSVHIALNELPLKYSSLNVNEKWLVYCAGGYRSMIAASYLRSKGFHFIANVTKGIAYVKRIMPELVEAGLETE